MNVGLDATPLLGVRTGVGQYVAGLLSGLASLPDGPHLTLVTFTGRKARPLAPPASNGASISVRGRRLPALLLQAGWSSVGWPPIEVLAGPLDVFHGTNFVQPPARRAAGVLTIHDLAFLRHPETVTRLAARNRTLVPRSIHRSAVVCAPTAAVAAEIADAYRISSDRLVVTHLGVRPAYLEAGTPTAEWLARRGVPPRYLLYVGTREPRKNLPVLVAAYRTMRASAPEMPPLVLVGPPGWGHVLQEGGGREQGVVSLGYVSDEDLVGIVGGAACLALPSRYEGFGLPVLEALACGVPVVAADVPALREVLGKAAEFVPIGDVEALADAIRNLLENGGGPAAAAARREHAAAFTWTACAKATLHAYKLARTA